MPARRVGGEAFCVQSHPHGAHAIFSTALYVAVTGTPVIVRLSTPASLVMYVENRQGQTAFRNMATLKCASQSNPKVWLSTSYNTCK
jgi:hypothetical protein